MATQTVNLNSGACAASSVNWDRAEIYQECGRIGGQGSIYADTWTFKWKLPECATSADILDKINCYLLPTSACNSLSAAPSTFNEIDGTINVTVGFQNSSGTWYPNRYTETIRSTDRNPQLLAAYSSSGFDSSDQTYFVISMSALRSSSSYYFVIPCEDSTSNNLRLSVETAVSAPSGTLSVDTATGTSLERKLTATVTGGCPRDITTSINFYDQNNGTISTTLGTSAAIVLPNYTRYPYPFKANATFTNAAGTTYSNTLEMRYGRTPLFDHYEIMSGATRVDNTTIQTVVGVEYVIRFYFKYWGRYYSFGNTLSNGLDYSSSTTSADVTPSGELTYSLAYMELSVIATEAGSHTISMTFSDNNGEYGSSERFVLNAPANNLPQVDLTQEPIEPQVTTPVTYTASVVVPSGEATMNWSVILPDNTEIDITGGLTNDYFTAVQVSPTVYTITYLKLGEYGVRCKATSNSGEYTNKRVTTIPTPLSLNVIPNISPINGAINDTEFQLSYTSDAQYPVTTQWTLTPSVDANIITGSFTSPSVSFTLPTEGVYSVSLQITGDYYNYEETVGTISTIEIPVDTSPLLYKFKIVLTDSNGDSVILFRNNINNNAQFQSLKIVEEINKIGLAQFSLVHGERISSTYLSAGTQVCIFHELYPIFYGTISEISEENISGYNSVTSQKVHNIKCESCEKILDTQLLSDEGIYTGSITNIAKQIIPTNNQGTISNDTSNIGLPVSKISRLVALNNLSDYTGWRYRGHPNVIASYVRGYYNAEGQFKSNTSIDTENGDLALIYYPNDLGKPGYVFGEVYGIDTSNNITLLSYTEYNLDPSNSQECFITILRGWAIDFMSSYYLDDPALTYRINQYAQNVSNSSNINDKFGTVSLYASDPNKMRIAKSIQCYKEVTGQRVIPKATYITNTYDVNVVRVELVDQAESAIDGQMNRRYNVYVTGWNFNSSVKYYCYGYNSSTGDMDYVVIGPSSLDPHIDVISTTQIMTSSGEKQTILYIGLDGDDENASGQPLLRVGASFICGQYTLLDGSLINPDMNIMIGSTLIESGSYTLVGNTLTITNLSSVRYRTQCSHLVGCLVFDINVESDSPYALYNPTTLTLQGPDGYTESQLELLACRYYQFGSTYKDRGTMSVPLPKYTYVDMMAGVTTFARPGSHIRLTQLIETGIQQDDYELLKYEMNADQFTVKVTYGMSEVTIMDRIYTLIKNNKMVFNQ